MYSQKKIIEGRGNAKSRKTKMKKKSDNLLSNHGSSFIGFHSDQRKGKRLLITLDKFVKIFSKKKKWSFVQLGILLVWVIDVCENKCNEPAYKATNREKDTIGPVCGRGVLKTSLLTDVGARWNATIEGGGGWMIMWARHHSASWSLCVTCWRRDWWFNRSCWAIS